MDKNIVLYKEIFDILAKGKNSFGTKELGEVMQSYGMKPSNIELEDIIGQLDINASGEVEFKEFVQFMTQPIIYSETEEELREAFSLFDLDGNGFLMARDIREALHKLGERLSDEEIDEMLKEINCENDEEIDIDEFINALTSRK